MIKITVPVTNGGKKRSSVANTRREQHHEDARCDDRPVDRVNAVLEADRDHRADGGERAACISGRRTPMRHKPTD